MKKGSPHETIGVHYFRQISVLKKKTGCLGYIGAGFLILAISGAIGSLMNNGSKKSTTPLSSKPTVSQTKSKLETDIFAWVTQTTKQMGF